MQVSFRSQGKDLFLLFQLFEDLFRLLEGKVHAHRKLPFIRKAPAETQHLFLGPFRKAPLFTDPQAVNDLGAFPPVFRRRSFQDHTASKGLDGRIKADNEPVPTFHRHRFLESELGVGLLPRADLLPIQEDHLADLLGRAEADMYQRVVFQLPLCVPEHLHLCVSHHAGEQHARGRQHVPALHFVFFQRQVQRRPLSGFRFRLRRIMILDAADADFPSLRVDHDLFPGHAGAFHQGPCHHRSEALHGKHPVHRETEQLRRAAAFRGVPYPFQDHASQKFNILAGNCRDPDRRRVFEETPFDKLPGILLHHPAPVFLGEIRLGKYEDPLFNVQHLQDLKMLPGLRHHAFIQPDDQKDEVNAADPRQHVLHEFFVARHVDDPDLQAFVVRQARKAEFNGDAPLLLLLEPVCVDSRQRLDEPGLSVVHMARCPDYHVMCHIVCSLQRHSPPAVFPQHFHCSLTVLLSLPEGFPEACLPLPDGPS